jgi:hypothetical protein
MRINKAMTVVGTIIEAYATDKKLPIYGFSAAKVNTCIAMHCFLLD